MVQCKRLGTMAVLAAASAFAVCGSTVRADITNGFASPGNWVLNAGTTAFTPFISASDLTLTTGLNNETTSAWYNTTQDVADSWTATFTYQLSAASPGSPADGFMFAVQNAGTNALGSGGGSKGYQGTSTGFSAVSPSVGQGIELYYQQTSDAQVGVNGQFVGGGPVSGSTLNLFTDTNPINYTISYYAATGAMSVSAVDSTNSADAYNYITYGTPNANPFLAPTPINMASTLGANTGYVGFTGATGGANVEQDFTNFNFTTNTGATQPAGYTPPITPAYILASRAPVALTANSFNVDNVVENTANLAAGQAISSNLATTVGFVNTFYEAGLSVGGVVQGGGLPTSHQFVSQADGDTTFQFQHYTNTNNALRLTSGTGGNPTGTMTLATPTGFATLAILATSTNAGGNSGGTVTLNFANGTSVTTDYGAPDWFAGTTNATTPDGNLYGVALGGVSRISVQNSGTSGLPGNPNLYETVLNLANLGTGTGTVNVAGQVLDSLTFNINPTTATTDIFAVSGSAVPEPAPLALFGAGTVGLLLIRRRRFLNAKS